MKNSVVFIALLITSASVLPAQETRGQILGRITDPSGCVVVAASVSAVNTATGVTVTGVTNGTGDYTLPFLVAGSYDITVTAPGFKKFEQGSVTVRIQDAIALNVKLQIGAATQVVNVKDTPPALEFSTASLGQVVDTQRISNLPVNYDNPLMLSSLGPGVINLLSASVANPFYPLLPGTGLSAKTTTVSQLLKSFPEFTGLNINDNQGYSWESINGKWAMPWASATPSCSARSNRFCYPPISAASISGSTPAFSIPIPRTSEPTTSGCSPLAFREFEAQVSA